MSITPVTPAETARGGFKTWVNSQRKFAAPPGQFSVEINILPKAKTARPHVPVIMITAYGDAETKRKALANGADAFLTKPIDFAIVRNAIDMRVGRAA
jgi:CheY-like chemotaxis protein